MSLAIERIRFAFKNETLTANSIALTQTPVTGYEAINLQDPVRSKLCKVDDDTMELIIKMTGNPWVNGLFVTGFDYPVETKLQLQNNDANSWGGNLKYDSALVDAYPAALVAGAGRAGQYGAGGYLTPPVAPFHRNILALYFDLFTDNWWRLVFTAPAGTSSISVGVASLCLWYEMTMNFTDDWSMTPVDTTPMIETTNGDSMEGRSGTRYELLKLNFTGVPADEMWYIHNEFKTLGKTPTFIEAHPGGGVDSPWTRLYGRITQYSGPKRMKKTSNRYNFNLLFREQPGELQ